MEFMATGGGPNKLIQLSELEEQAIQLCGLINTVDGIGCLSQGVPDKENVESGSELSDENIIEPTISVQCHANKRQSARDLLELQITQQKEFHMAVETLLTATNKKIDDFVHYQRQSAKAMQSINSTLTEQINEQKRHNMEMEKLKLQKLELKRKMLDMQIDYVNKSQ
ncbi:uncharacterized protein LOC131439214 [Malaya genurostris]|nr:uncharacterized protein LOC131439214 [Malaya genurostris]